ncbi:MAG TPA: nitroreductase family protein, partial [Herpetosiphonaceae bacterium]
LTANGKVDRSALPDPATHSASAPPAPSTHAPRTETIARLVASVFKLDQIDHDADLLSFGANSVDIVRIANLLEAEFGFRPRLDELVRLSTPRAIAEFYAQRTAQDASVTSRTAPPTSATPDPTLAFDVLDDPEERTRFKSTQPGLRRDAPARPRISLADHTLDSDPRSLARERRSHRTFDSQPLSFAQLSVWLACLRQETLDGTPKYAWGSAGGLYPVQAYLYIKPDRVAGIAAGTYYYHPADHCLVQLASTARLDRNLHAWINQPIFDRSAFSLFLLGKLSAIGPMYGQSSRDFCLIEAGLITQHLEISAPASRIGLCQIGNFDFAPIRHWFDLADDHIYLHSLLGGPIDPVNSLSAATDDARWDEGEL